ncbi:hypothetical protein D3C80_2179980 [compost metagenome]
MTDVPPNDSILLNDGIIPRLRLNARLFEDDRPELTYIRILGIKPDIRYTWIVEQEILKRRERLHLKID